MSCTSTIGNTDLPECDLSEYIEREAARIQNGKSDQIEKGMRIGQAFSTRFLSADTLNFQSEWQFLLTHFNVQDPKFEGLWFKNVMIKGPKSMLIEYLSADKSNPFRFLRIYTENNAVYRIECEKADFSWIGNRIYALDWKLGSVLRYSMRIEGDTSQSPIKLSYVY